jgi:ABC-type transporter Mla MlaB component
MTRDSTHIVEITGDAGLRAAQEIATALRKAIAANQAISIATDAISTADITTIQLLLAARKLAQASGKSLSLAAAPSGPLRDLLIETGVLDADGRPLTPDGDFWSPISSPAKGKAI